MSDINHILFILGALAVSTKLLFPSLSEGYFGVGPPQTIKVNQVAASPKTGMFFDVPGNYQSMLAPRFSNVDYGSLIRYSMPDSGKLAVDPNNPLSLPNRGQSGIQIRENYVPEGEALQYIDIKNALPANGNAASSGAQMAPMGDLDVNALGESNLQPVVYDRFMVSNQKSRLRGLGDPIRGDLPIVPVQNGWFRPSVTPNIDLRDGAIMVLAGANNDTQKQLAALRSAAAGGLSNVGSGISYTVSNSPYSMAAGADVQVTAFP